jgi:hypothetical protein
MKPHFIMNHHKQQSLMQQMSSQLLRMPIKAWSLTLWPALATLCGILYLHQAVADSVRSMPHPILLVAIVVGALSSWIAICFAQWRYTREAELAQQWKSSKPATGGPLPADYEKSAFSSTYKLLSGSVSPPNIQQALTHELESGEIALDRLLEFATFMGNALVGLGLVGTFIGLLGSLQDLSGVFNALIDSGGSQTISPTALFTDMITRLQSPMRAMGTAFIASLYGLLGSLVVSLMLVGARKSVAHSASLIHQLITGYSYKVDEIRHQEDPRFPQVKWAEFQHAMQHNQASMLEFSSAFDHLLSLQKEHAQLMGVPVKQLVEHIHTCTTQLQQSNDHLLQSRADIEALVQQLAQFHQAAQQQMLAQNTFLQDYMQSQLQALTLAREKSRSDMAMLMQKIEVAYESHPGQKPSNG